MLVVMAAMMVMILIRTLPIERPLMMMMTMMVIITDDIDDKKFTD